MYAFAAVGPAFGYIFGGYFLTIYVDIGRVDMDRCVFDMQVFEFYKMDPLAHRC